MTTSLEQVRVLAEHRGLLAVYKPAELATEPTERSIPSLVDRVSAIMGSAQVRAASRLDVGVSGVVLCTTSRAAARRVDQQRRAGRIARYYVALAGNALSGRGSWRKPLGRQRDGAGRIRSSHRAAQTRHARTDYAVVGLVQGPAASAMLVLRPRTGRMHQLRAHAAEAGAPLLGDGRYGGPSTVVTSGGRVEPVNRIALHAAHVHVDDALCATAPVPDLLRELWSLLGGSSEDWQRAARRITDW